MTAVKSETLAKHAIRTRAYLSSHADSIPSTALPELPKALSALTAFAAACREGHRAEVKKEASEWEDDGVA